MSWAGSGFCTYFRNWASLAGTDVLKWSFNPRGMTTSFTSGMPRRETLIQSPESFDVPPDVDRTLVLRRSVWDQTPMMALGSSGPLGFLPLAVRRSIGTWRAMVWT